MPRKSAAAGGSALQPELVRQIRHIVQTWGARNYRRYPWRTAKKSWHGLVAEVLLQRTRADSVVPVYRELTRRFSTPEALGRASLKEVRALILPLGLRWRAPLLKKLGTTLSKGGGQVPRDTADLVALPGIGAYAATAWLSFHGGQRAVIIDANVVRLICRLTGRPMDGETRRKAWLKTTADILTPPRSWKQYNYAVLDFAMQVCTRNPDCPRCPLLTRCKYGRTTIHG